jgi:hypothetical protein
MARKKYQAGGEAAAEPTGAVDPMDLASQLQSWQGDPDVIPAGSMQATTTKEAQEEARKILGRVGKHDIESEELQKKLESSAEASKAALQRAQNILLQYSAPGGPLWPSQQELGLRQLAAFSQPTPGAGVWGALGAGVSHATEEQARQMEEQRAALGKYLELAAGTGLAEQFRKIDTDTVEGRRKILDMMYKSDAQLGRAAMTALGRSLSNPALTKGITPQSPFGKIALDALGPAAWVDPTDPTKGFSDAYRMFVAKLNNVAIQEAKAKAGIDEDPTTPAERLDAANQAGVPFDAGRFGMPDPTRMSTKQRQTYYAAQEKNWDNQSKTYGDADQQLMNALHYLDEFQELNKRTYTGPAIAPYRIGGVHAGPHGAGVDLSSDAGWNINLYGFLAHLKGDIQLMDKDAANVVAQAIPSHGFGRVTNRDLSLFQTGSIGTDKLRSVNDAIALALRISLNNQIQRHQFEAAYYGAHRTLDGAEHAWMNYLDNNPIFDHGKPTLPNGLKPLNEHRMDWRDYFRSVNPREIPEQIETGVEEGAPGRPIIGASGRPIPGTAEPPVRGGYGTPISQPADTIPARGMGGRVRMQGGGRAKILTSFQKALSLLSQAAKQGRDLTEPEWWAVEHYGMHDAQTGGMDQDDFAQRINQAMQSGQGKKLKFNLDSDPLEGHELAIPSGMGDKDELNTKMQDEKWQEDLFNNADYHAFLREGLQRGFDPLNIGHLLPKVSIHPLGIDASPPGDMVMHHVEVRGPADVMQQMKSALTSQPEATMPGQGPTTLQAEGGRVGMAEGDQPEERKPDPEIADSLASLKQGLTLKAAGAPEDPNSPFENIMGELGGGALIGAGLLGALRYPERTARFMARHPAVTASGIGGLFGGVAGQMGTGDFWPGAVQGAVLGPGFAKLGRGASAPLLRLTSELSRSAGPGVRKSLEAIDLDQPRGGLQAAADQLMRDARMKIPSTLAEAAGPRSVGLASAALRKDVPESAAMLGALQAREAQTAPGVGETVNQAFKPDDYYAKTEQLRNELYTKAAPLYEQAYSQFPSVKTQTLMGIMNTPSGQEAAARAFRMMQDMQVPIGQADVTGMVQNPSLQYLDQVKRALDDMIIGEEGSGINYQATQQGRILRDMRSKLVNELDQATVGPNGRSPYREARDQYAGDLDIMDALRGGRETFDKLTPQEVQQLMGKLDWSARDAYRTGVAEGIMQKIGNMAANRNTARAVIANPNLQAKILATFDNPRDGQRFIDSLARQAEVFATGRQMIRAGEAGQTMSVQPKSIGQMMRSHLMRKGTAADISETMGTMANDPLAREKMDRLQDTADTLRRQKEISRLLGGATAAGMATAMTPSPQTEQGQ